MAKKKVVRKAPKKKASVKKASRSPKKRASKPKAEKTYVHLPQRTETEITESLNEDLRDAWKRLREFLGELGEQEVRTSHHAIMFAGKVCYTFVRPKKKYLEVCVFLPEVVDDPMVNRADQVSKGKYSHMIRVTHRDQVEEPLTDWIRQAYETYA